MQVVNEPGKTRRFGSTLGRTQDCKKAMCAWPKARASTTRPRQGEARIQGSNMALIKLKPTSPGARFVVKIDRSHLHKGGPHAPLTVHQNKTGARNHSAASPRVTRAAARKQKYRIIDFLRDKDGIAGKVERLEYDPNRTAHIALVMYADGERRYILAPKGVQGRRRDPLGLRCARSRPAMRWRCATFRSAARCTTSR